jgi:hypothetical protein
MQKNKIALISLTALVLPVLALAQMQTTAPGGPNVQITDFQSVIESIENMVGLVFGAVAVVCFVVAGILFLTANGAPEKIQAARSAFIWGVAGVIVGIMAFSIIAIVASML